jgi:hypothetical protein
MKACCREEVERILSVYTIIISTMKSMLSAYDEYEEMLGKQLYEQKENHE